MAKGCPDFEWLREATESELLRTPGIGRGSIEEIRRVLGFPERNALDLLREELFKITPGAARLPVVMRELGLGTIEELRNWLQSRTTTEARRSLKRAVTLVHWCGVGDTTIDKVVRWAFPDYDNAKLDEEIAQARASVERARHNLAIAEQRLDNLLDTRR